MDAMHKSILPSVKIVLVVMMVFTNVYSGGGCRGTLNAHYSDIGRK